VSGETLKGIRERLGFSLRDVEEITNRQVSNAYLSQLENGKIKAPSVQVACELAAAYAVPIDEMVSLLSVPPQATPAVLCPTCGRAMGDQK
jgi:transcriptional regulator with XRE-family HTH domain